MPALVKLNVGGTCFTTTESTLTKESRYFAALLSGDYSDAGAEEVSQLVQPDVRRVGGRRGRTRARSAARAHRSRGRQAAATSGLQETVGSGAGE